REHVDARRGRRKAFIVELAKNSKVRELTFILRLCDDAPASRRKAERKCARRITIETADGRARGCGGSARHVRHVRRGSISRATLKQVFARQRGRCALLRKSRRDESRHN